MSDHLESRTPYFGQLDFFLYLAPGTIVLISLILLFGVSLTGISEKSTVVMSILAIFVAYFLGHAVYPLNYGLRKTIHKKLVEKKKEKETKAQSDLKKEESSGDQYEKDYFGTNFQTALAKHKDFCLSQLIRYRSLSRFTTAMLFPCLLLGFGIAIYLLFHLREPINNSLKWSVAIVSLFSGIGAAIGFFKRYERYWKRIITILERCKECPSKSC